MSEQDSRLGSKITTLRESLGLSAAELAERCDCEVIVIEQLESGDIAPSLAPLIKITRALGVRLGTLVDDDTAVGPVVTRGGTAGLTGRVRDLETGDGAGRLDFYSLAEGKTTRHMEPFLIEITPSPSGEPALSSHEGEEFIYVLEGDVEIEYGKDTLNLEPGDSVYYDSIVPHEVRAGGNASAKILAVVYAPL
jgi:transcriptional regulator with XRE-family HTH domain